MNKERRKQLSKAIDLLAEARDIIETAAAEERDYYDNMPESLQSGDKGQRADEVASSLEEMDSALDDLTSQLSDAMGE